MGSGLRLGLIGAGGIAEFHAPALQHAGFELAAIAALPDSARARDFAARHGVVKVFDDAPSLLDARDEWDALVITVPIESTLEVLTAALETSAPILVEKPVALRAADLEALAQRDLPVLVGYNRRFYRSVTSAREEVWGGPPVVATLTLPENLGADEGQSLLHFFANSVHGLDMARYVFGHLEVVAVERVRDEHNQLCGVAGLLRSERGDAVHLVGSWGAPANYAMTIDRPGRRTELRPLEQGTVYDSMEVVDPTPEVPIRTYRPRISSRIELDPIDVTFKPGFVAQAEAFARLCSDEDPGGAARLADAHAVLALAEALAGAVPPVTS